METCGAKYCVLGPCPAIVKDRDSRCRRDYDAGTRSGARLEAAGPEGPALAEDMRGHAQGHGWKPLASRAPHRQKKSKKKKIQQLPLSAAQFKAPGGSYTPVGDPTALRVREATGSYVPPGKSKSMHSQFEFSKGGDVHWCTLLAASFYDVEAVGS
jgi:hypothetical protein